MTEHWKAQWKALKPRDKIATLATALVAVVGLVQAGIFENTNNTMQAEQRAWLAPQPLELPPLFKASVNALDQIKGNTRISVGVANVGREPATKTNAFLFATVFPIALFRDQQAIERMILHHMDGRSCPVLPLDRSNGRAIFPNTPAAFDVDLSEDDTRLALADPPDRNNMAIVAGCLVYETLDQKRYSEVCAALEPLTAKDGGGFKPIKCITYNAAD